MTHPQLHIIGGGLAGSEAAWQAARAGVHVRLYEMRPKTMTPAHQTPALAELVCSNSFRSDDAQNNAVGLLHAEMRLCNSLIMEMADRHKLPAGGALAVDRNAFSAAVTAALDNAPRITVARSEVTRLPEPHEGPVIVATGPLTSAALAQSIQAQTGSEHLAFFDAIAPIVYADSIDMNICWYQSRYDKPGPAGSGADYLNCPMDAAQYDAFINALLEGESADFREWEKDTPYFEGCLPVEVMARRGRETLRYGPMKPVGLRNPNRPDNVLHAVVQLRQDNALGTLWNMVGFQTKLTYGAQTGVFRLIPGLERARFARLGGIHRNTFLHSPRLLDRQLRLKTAPHLRFAGQMTGVEGYVESAACGLIAGRFAAAEIHGTDLPAPSPATAMGSLLQHITGGHISADDGSAAGAFQPMNVNFGLFPPVAPQASRNGKRLRGKQRKQARRQALSARALHDMAAWSALEIAP